MPRQLIVLANSSLCRLLGRDGDADPVVALAVLKHPDSRLPGHLLASDRPGHESVDRSSGGNRFEPRSDVRRKEHSAFAHEVAEELGRRLAAGEYHDLWLLASSPFVGELNSALPEPVARRVRLTLATDWTSLGLDEIDARLRTLHPSHAPAEGAQG
jgi:protein required for attachment to host cells